MPRLSSEDLSRTLENALYTAVGLGILGFQHLQVQRQQLKRALRSALSVEAPATPADAAENADG